MSDKVIGKVKHQSKEFASAHARPAMWAQAVTFEDLCNLTVLWLNGDIPYFPGNGGSRDCETGEIKDALINFNQKGLLTTFSQPARALTKDGFAQRAAVDGFAKEVAAKRIAALSLFTDLLVFVIPPTGLAGY